MVVPNTWKPLPQYHYDIGFNGVFAHYRSETPPEFDEKKVVDCLAAIAVYKEKDGYRLDNVAHLMQQMQDLSDMGFYLVNFETKHKTESFTPSSIPIVNDLVTMC